MTQPLYDVDSTLAGRRRLTRTELFELVWKEPMRTLASKFGLSDVGLAKLCKRSAIPLPPPGYWAANDMNRHRRPELPPAPRGHRETLLIVPSAVRRVDVENELPQDIAAKIAALRADSDPIAIPENLPKNNPIIGRWDTEDMRLRGSYTTRRPPLSPVEKRRRRILSSLVREIEKLEGRVTAIDRYKFKATVVGEEVEFSLREKRKQVQIALTQEERQYSFYSDRGWRPSLAPTGDLILRFENYFDRPIQRQWTDLNGRPLEGRLRDILIGLLIAAGEVGRRRIEHERQERERLRATEERHAAEERRRLEQARLEQLREDASAWAEARLIREYIVAVLGQPHGPMELTTRLKAWAEEGRRMANSIDPLLRLA